MGASFVRPPAAPPAQVKLGPNKRANRYPWKEWFKPGAGPVTLVAGRDYPGDMADVWMLQSIWRQARRTGVRVTCSVKPGTIVLTVRGKRPPKPDPRAVKRALVRKKKLNKKGKK